MPNDKKIPKRDTEHGGSRPSPSNTVEPFIDTNPKLPEIAEKGYRPAEGQRPSPEEPQASLGPTAGKPGSGVPPKKQ